MPKPTNYRGFISITPFDAKGRAPLLAAITWHVKTYLGEDATIVRTRRTIRVTLPSTGQRWTATLPKWASDAEIILKMTRRMGPEITRQIGFFDGFNMPLIFVGKESR